MVVISLVTRVELVMLTLCRERWRDKGRETREKKETVEGVSVSFGSVVLVLMIDGYPLYLLPWEAV